MESHSFFDTADFLASLIFAFFPHIAGGLRRDYTAYNARI